MQGAREGGRTEARRRQRRGQKRSEVGGGGEKRERLWRTRNKGREGEGAHSDTEAQGCPISQGSASPLGQRVRPDAGEGVKSPL